MNKIIFGDCRESLRQLAAEGVVVQTCVTSPPYFGLRSYLPDDHPDKAKEAGLEQTPEQFIANMVEVFRCVWDVLADDGTLWVNIGDTYASAWPCNRRNVIGSGSLENGKRENRPPRIGPGLKEKDLIGIPWMLAFALRADGWYLRQDIIWNKPNPMPESVKDRCTKAHEYIFLLSKSERYFFDWEAMREDAVKGAAGSSLNSGKTAEHQLGRSSVKERVEDGKRNRRSVWSISTRPYKGAHFATFPPDLIEPCILAGSRPGDIVLDPFMGSGTTAEVSILHGRQYLGCELNENYKVLQDERIVNAQESVRLATAQAVLFPNIDEAA